jgi:hypothetical protein
VKLLRSWPAQMPPGPVRGHVVDAAPHLDITGHAYGRLADVDDDVLLLEWDVAVDRPALLEFAQRAAARPDAVLTAPYLLYNQGQEKPFWSVRLWDGPGAAIGRALQPGEDKCNLFALGMTYLPRDVIRGFTAAVAGARSRGHEWGWSDVNLSFWHYQNVDRWVDVAWDLRPVHLHFDVPTAMIEAMGRSDG